MLERLTLKRLLGMRKGSHRERVARLWRLRTILLACGVVNLLTACARVAMGEEPNGLGLIGLLLLITTLPQRKALKRLIRRGDLPERKAAAATR
ncbi:MAG: hypothetical protein JWM64_1060 [Frankiales bacterium]|nr:hypothetical protein [Frankiales bacterium]